MSLSEEDQPLTLFDAVKHNNESAIRDLLSSGADVNITDEQWRRTPLFYAVLGNFENVVHLLIKAGANVNIKDKEGNCCLFFAVLANQQNITLALIAANADVNAIDKFQKRTPLFYAVGNNNREVVETLIGAGADVSNTDSDGQTALFYALRNQNENIVRALIDAGVDVNKTDSCGQTALFYALRNQNEHMVRALIDAGADIKKIGEYVQTDFLFRAVRNGNHSIAGALIDAAANGNSTGNYNETALFIAVRYCNESIVRMLIEAGVDVNKTDNNDQTALFSSIEDNNEGIVQTLGFGQTALFSAVNNNNGRIVRALIEAGADVNKSDFIGQTALFSASMNDNESIVRVLIEAGADVNKTDIDGQTALFSASMNDNESIVRVLIEAGTDVNKTDIDGQTALLSAIENHNESIVRVLIEAGNDVNKTDNYGQTALLSASKKHNEGIVRVLIEAGADVNKTDIDGQTALFSASMNDNESIVRVLIEAGADVNKTDIDGQTALLSAIENHNESIVRVLIEAGADVNKTDNYGQTALLSASKKHNESIVRVLIEAGADVNKTDKDGETALLIAVRHNNAVIVQVLIGGAADVNKTNIFGQTAFFSAVRNDNERILQALIAAGADVNMNAPFGPTTLFIAVMNNNENIVRVLVEAGADVNNTENDGETALLFAVRYNNAVLVQALIDGGADVNKTDIIGKTALFSASMNDNESIMRVLIEAGADVNKTDNDGQTALFNASKNHNESIVRVLIEAGADVNKTDNAGQTALFNASMNDNECIVRMLIEADVDVNKTDIDDQTALFNASMNYNESIVRVLIEAGADVNKTDIDDQTALFNASMNYNESIVRVLIEAGADVNKTDIIGQTALFNASKNHNESIVRVLMEAGADVNKTDNDGQTALFNASMNDNESIVRVLIEAGADVNKTDKDGETGLFIAVRHNNESIVRTLIGVDDNKSDNNCKGALIYVSDNNLGGAISLLNGASADVIEATNEEKTLSQTKLGQGSDVKAIVNVRNRYGRTPLFYALQSHSPSVVCLLLENGGNLYFRDNCNLSILSFFIDEVLKENSYFIDVSGQLNLLFRNGVAESLVEKALIEVLFCRTMLLCTPLRGEFQLFYISSSINERNLSEFLSRVDVSTRQIIQNIFEHASSGQLFQVVTMFSNLGPDPNSADSDGNTCLHYVTLLPFGGVSQTKVMNICHLLRTYGATMNFKNHQGQTPLLFCLSELSLHSEWLLRTDGPKMLIEICSLLLDCGTKVDDTLPNGKSIFHLTIDLFQDGLRLQDEALRLEVINEMLKLMQLFSVANAKQAKSFTNGIVHLHLIIHQWASLTLRSSQEYSSNITHIYTFEEVLKAILQLLLECGAKPNARDDDERTPLHYCKTWSAVKMLIDAGAKAYDLSGYYPLIAAAERGTFLERPECFYPDVSEDPRTFWRNAIKMNLDPWAVDQHDNSVLSIMIKHKAFVLAKVLVEVTCEDKQIESDTIAYPILNAICKDQSSHTRWKTNLVKMILNSRRKVLLVNLHVPLRFCCKNIVEFVGRSNDGSSSFYFSDDSSSNFSDDSSSDFSYDSSSDLHLSKGKKRKFVDDYFESEYAHDNAQPVLKKRKTGVACDDVENGKTENRYLPFYDSVHYEIAELLLSYGADCRKSDSTGDSCLELAETCPELKQLLLKPIDVNKISKRIPWESVSKRYQKTLAKVSRGQEKEIIGSFWFHKEHIGSGAYGQVFAGINEKDGREVAIKRIQKFRMVRPEDEREITNLTKLADCQQVVSYVSFLEDEHFAYIVLELMEGDLEHFFNEGPVDKSKSVLLCKDVIEGLEYLRKQKIIHRDLKPGNILYKTHPRLCLKIADFGLSCYCVNNTSTTVYGRTVAGTRCWIAPEILASQSGNNFTENSDTFSCGLLVHYILSEQKHPFSSPSSSAPLIIENNILNNKMEGWDARISSEGTDLIIKMLENCDGERISPADALDHPFFWTQSKMKDFLIAVGNQPEFELPPSNPNRKCPETDLEKDLNSSLSFQTVVKCDSWDDPRNKLMPKFYSNMKKGGTMTLNQLSTWCDLYEMAMPILTHCHIKSDECC